MTEAPTKRALVLGSNGQDGSFLTEHLLRRGYAVTGVSRQMQSVIGSLHPRFDHVCLDLKNIEDFKRLLGRVRPDFIFHVAALHGRAGTSYESDWADMWKVNVGIVHPCLEYLRTEQADGVLIYAGSSKVFGPIFPAVVTEQSPMASTCLYTVTKNAALDLIRCYRRDHGILSSVLHLFHHESERRQPEFFIPKLVATLHRALGDRSYRAEFDTLQFHCDWGSAREYMDIAVDVAERRPTEDVIVATGRTWSGQELAERLFADHGLDHRTYLIERTDENRFDRFFQVSVDALTRLIGRSPTIGIVEVCNEMLAALRQKEHERAS